MALADRGVVALGVQGPFSGKMRNISDNSNGVIATRCVEIPVVGRDGEISGVLCRTARREGMRRVVFSSGPEEGWSTGDVAQSAVHDIKNLLAVIGSGLRLLQTRDDAACRKVIVGKMQEAITRGSTLTNQLLNTPLPCLKPVDGFVTGSRLAAIVGTLDLALRPDISVRTEIAPDLWTFSAEPEELYFALLNLCRNADDAMLSGGTITIVARNADLSESADGGFVEIVVADEGEGMPEEILLRAFLPYFTTKAALGGSGVGLPQVRRFAEKRGGAIYIESERGAGTLVRLRLPRVSDTGIRNSLVGPDSPYTP
ncbi:ATP-binding protein (plasmid) [Bradyrhizobium lupini]|uniref:ATP-binding protein n=1 Tax=Rhizobium lupini TaxID=136996 RepID=UPI00366ECC29